MHEFVELLKSPLFWLATVVVSYLINLASHYSVEPLNWLFRSSGRWIKLSTQKERLRRAELVIELADPESRANARHIYVTIMLRCLFSLVCFMASFALLVLVMYTEGDKSTGQLPRESWPSGFIVTGFLGASMFMLMHYSNRLAEIGGALKTFEKNRLELKVTQGKRE